MKSLLAVAVFALASLAGCATTSPEPPVYGEPQPPYPYCQPGEPCPPQYQCAPGQDCPTYGTAPPEDYAPPPPAGGYAPPPPVVYGPVQPYGGVPEAYGRGDRDEHEVRPAPPRDHGERSGHGRDGERERGGRDDHDDRGGPAEEGRR